MNALDLIRTWHASRLAEPAEVEIDAWLSEVVAGECDCGNKWRRFEWFNGRCEECRRLEPSQSSSASCGCVGVVYSQQGWHIDSAGAAYERCPAYWRAAGLRVVPKRFSGDSAERLVGLVPG